MGYRALMVNVYKEHMSLYMGELTSALMVIHVTTTSVGSEPGADSTSTATTTIHDRNRSHVAKLLNSTDLTDGSDYCRNQENTPSHPIHLRVVIGGYIRYSPKYDRTIL